MEKRGVIEEGRTPPEEKPGEKAAAAKAADAGPPPLDDHLAKRLDEIIAGKNDDPGLRLA